jgi:energy-coupling factor transporter ATP-binding protein EcfA2
VRCFEDVEVPLDPRVTVIIGENGAGKTTIAEAMASLSAGDGEGLTAFPLRHGAGVGDGAIELFEAGAKEPAARWTPGERRRLPESRFLFAYGRYRRVQPPERPLAFADGQPLYGAGWTEEAWSDRQKSSPIDRVLGRRTLSLFASDHYLLRELGQELVDLSARRQTEAQVAEAWRALSDSLRSLDGGIEGIDVVERAGRDVVVVRRNGVSLDLRELSDGYQAILVVVIDLLIRRAFLASEWGALPPAAAKPERPAAMTVLIDEVDLHLHPRWQRSVLRQLTTLFPDVQFVITTHSPAVVQGAIDDRYAVLVLREDEGKRVTIAALSAEQRRALRGAHLGSLLVDHHLFGVGSRFSPRYEAQEKKVRRLRRKLERQTATPEDRKELIAALEKLQLLVVREERRWVGQSFTRELTKAQLASVKELVTLNEERRRGSA